MVILLCRMCVGGEEAVAEGGDGMGMWVGGNVGGGGGNGGYGG